MTTVSNRPATAALSCINRLWPGGRSALGAACLAAAGATASERVGLNNGEVSAVRRDQGTFAILLNGTLMREVSASEVSLYRVASQTHIEYVIVELWQPGLNCQRSYVMLALDAHRTGESSRVFGECMNLRSASHVSGGVRVELIATVQSGESKAVVEHYLYSNGKLTKQRAPRSAAKLQAPIREVRSRGANSHERSQGVDQLP